MNFKSMMTSDPLRRNGKHKQIVTMILSDLIRYRPALR
jgi:hypothetical protein